MTTEEFRQVLIDIWNHQKTVDEAWRKIDGERYKKEGEWWLPLQSTDLIE